MVERIVIVRPYGIIIDGALELGLEIELHDGKVEAIRPHTGIPENYVLSPAFVNAHSHLEYRALQGRVGEKEWWPWIRQLTRRKAEELPEDVRSAALLAAKENRRTGVAWIGEHADRPYAGEALATAGVGGVIFQEVITFFESASPEQKLREVAERAESQRQAFQGDVWTNPHALYTVDRDTLRTFGQSGLPMSLHLAESMDEREFFQRGQGPIADFYKRFDVPFAPSGGSAYATAKELGLVRMGVQLVHACDLDDAEIADLASSGATVAHCPRSNMALGCPEAKVREMIDAGISVGLGMDSPASSGPIDMFAEMRAALHVSTARGAPITPEEAWRMATQDGASSLGKLDWMLKLGAETPLIKIEVPGAWAVGDLIERGSPEAVAWV